MRRIVSIALMAIVLASVAAVSNVTSHGEPLNEIQDSIKESQNACFNAAGRFESQVLPCPGICTQGKLIGSLNGDYSFTGDKLFPAGEPTIPNVMFYTGFSRVRTLKGDINLTDAGALDTATGKISALLTVTGGTGEYSQASGFLHVFGGEDFGTGSVSGKFEGTICK